MIGFALIARGLASRSWSLLLAITGVFYAVFGAVRLGVTIDLVLLLGAAGLLVLVPFASRPRWVRPAARY